MDIKMILSSLSDEELIGQLLCYDIYPSSDSKEVEALFKHVHPGSFFFDGLTPKQVEFYKEMAEKYAPLPLLVAADVESGPGDAFPNEATLTQEMAWGASNDPALLYEAGIAIGEKCRENGMNYNFSPIVDLAKNFQAPAVNIRAISDDPTPVVRMSKSYIEGLQKNGNVAATAKHFPGEGMDDRNPHFVTTINPMSQEEWLNSFGKIYKELIDAGVYSIMVGHTSLPSFESEADPLFGAKPACQSYDIITKLLKGRLGFEGVVVSDSMAMIGVAASVSNINDLAINFINAGGDLVLFPEKNDFDSLLLALQEGRIQRDRVLDAVSRLLRMKEKLHLFDKDFKASSSSKRSIPQIGEEIAEKAIRIERNLDRVLPLDLPKGSKILMLDVFEPYFHKEPTGKELSKFKETLEAYGMNVEERFNLGYLEIEKIMKDFDAVIVCAKISSKDYHGATLRIGWYNMMTFWRAYVFKHPKFVFVSFGDPYELYDFPYLKTYVNAFSNTYPSQEAVAKLLLGKIEEKGRNPISFEPYFKREI